MVLCRFDNISKRYANKTVVQPVSGEIHAGNRIFLHGKNGAGKSTFIRMLAGVYRPNTGKVEQEASLDLLAHESMLYSRLNAEDNLKYAAGLNGSEESQIEEILRDLGLWPYRHLKVDEYSRGMLQKLTLARVILREPELLLLDEPYTGLDSEGQEFLSKLLREGGVPERGWELKAWLLVDHDIERGNSLAGEVWSIEAGSLRR